MSTTSNIGASAEALAAKLAAKEKAAAAREAAMSLPKHRELLCKLPPIVAAFRGCWGLAMTILGMSEDSWIESMSHTFIPNRFVMWASLWDMPAIGLRPGKPSRRATLRHTTMRFGRPCLSRGAELLPGMSRGLEGPRTWNLSGPHMPGIPTVAGTPEPLGHFPQFERVFCGLEWAMTSTAFHFSRNWQPDRQRLLHALGVRRNWPKDEGLFLFGDGAFDCVEEPRTWMPVAYVGFPERLHKRLFDLATKPGVLCDNVARVIPDDMCDALLDAVDAPPEQGGAMAYRATYDGWVESITPEMQSMLPIYVLKIANAAGTSEVMKFSREAVFRCKTRQSFRAGEVLAYETIRRARGWKRAWPELRLDMLANFVGRDRFDAWVKIWFERQVLRITPGFVHVPLNLVKLAILSSAVDSELVWDVTNAMPYYREDCDAFSFPTLRLNHWHDFVGNLPGDIAYDLTPVDDAFIGEESVKELQKRHDAARLSGEKRRKTARWQRRQ